MEKRGISAIVTTVLIILLSIAAVGILFAVIIKLTSKTDSENGLLSTFTGETKFDIEKLTSEDMINDRFKIRNIGQRELTDFKVEINGDPKTITGQKSIGPQESAYLYLGQGNYFPLGSVTLKVTSNGYADTTTFNSEENWKLVLGSYNIQ